MMTIDPDKVRFIIQRARVFDADMPDSDEDPGSDLANDEIGEIDDEVVGAEENTEEHVLEEVIRDMNEDEQIELVALTWVGRGSFTKGEWTEALEEARRAHNTRTAEYLIGIPMLADYLEEGLGAFGHNSD